MTQLWHACPANSSTIIVYEIPWGKTPVLYEDSISMICPSTILIHSIQHGAKAPLGCLALRMLDSAIQSITEEHLFRLFNDSSRVLDPRTYTGLRGGPLLRLAYHDMTCTVLLNPITSRKWSKPVAHLNWILLRLIFHLDTSKHQPR